MSYMKVLIISGIIIITLMGATYMALNIPTHSPSTTVPVVITTDSLPPGAVVMYPGDRIRESSVMFVYSGILHTQPDQVVFTVCHIDWGVVQVFPTLNKTFKVWDVTYKLLAVDWINESVTVVRVP